MTVAMAVGFVLSLLVPVEGRRLRPPSFESLHLVDRNGRSLGESLTAEETSARWVALEAMSPDLAAAAVAAEDRRFHSHFGLDPVAIVRAVKQNLMSRRTVSGASTLTQQVARMMLADEARARGAPPVRRGLRRKLVEAHLALRLERSFDKRALLEAWLNRVPVGGVGVGVAAGAERYFGRSCANLSLAQAALLVGLARGPSITRPDRDPAGALRRRSRVLDAMVRAGVLTPERMADAQGEPLETDDTRAQPFRARLGAWVATELAQDGRPVSGQVATTIDAQLEERVRELLKGHVDPLRVKGVKSGAVVVLDHRTDELVAMVGSVDETDPRWGQVHAAFALRQPGSALKPFTYLAALEEGRTLASLAADIEQAFPDQRGAYLPANYDHRFHGPVRYREALAQSLNVAAVDVLQSVGVRPMARVLERAGFSTLQHTPEHYGLGLTLGSLDVQLIELAEAYAVLARGGIARPTRILKGTDRGTSQRVFDERHAWLIGDVLSDADARAPQFGLSSVLRTPYWTAVKTGTSKGFRDNLCVGFSDRYTVAVWVGDPSGKPMEGVSGVSGAGPVWRSVMDLLHADLPSARPLPPAGLATEHICPLSGQKVGPDCPGAVEEWFTQEAVPVHSCAMHRRVRLALSDGLPVPQDCGAKTKGPTLETLLPSPFDAWAVAERAGLPDVVSSACPSPPAPGRPPVLLSPARRELVRIDTAASSAIQRMLLLADVGDYRGPVTFSVDGEHVDGMKGPRAALWTVTPGEHRVTARYGDHGVESEAHVVVVR
jgi:penicillin-binding protein 1C